MAKQKGKSTSRTRSFIQRHVKKHVKQGMPQKRAVAAAYSEARRKGHKVPKRKSRR